MREVREEDVVLRMKLRSVLCLPWSFFYGLEMNFSSKIGDKSVAPENGALLLQTKTILSPSHIFLRSVYLMVH